MTDRTKIAHDAAKILFDIKAVNFRPEQPYIFTSGLASPVYINCRQLISFVNERTLLMNYGAEIISNDIGLDKIQGVAGGESAGIPYGAWMAHLLNKPMTYVRKKPKGHGLGQQIEGVFNQGDNIILVEDQATDGGSKVKFIEAIRAAGGRCNDTFVVYYYDIFDTKKVLEDKEITIHALCTAKDLISVARQYKIFDENNLAQVEDFCHNPLKWSKAHGGADKILGSE